MPDGRLAAPLRLSLDSLDDFFVMQEKPMAAGPMPSRAGEEAGYRREAGTSIAVRIDPAKADVSLQTLLENAEKAFFFPPARVFINDAEQPRFAAAELERPIITGPLRYPVTKASGMSQVDWLSVTTDLTVLAIPLDLTTSSPTPAVRGQLIALTAEALGTSSFLGALPEKLRSMLPADLTASLEHCISGRGASLELDKGGVLRIKVQLSCDLDIMKRFRNWGQSIGRSVRGESIDWWVLNSEIKRVEERNDAQDRGLRGTSSRRRWVTLEEIYSVKCDDFMDHVQPVLRSTRGWLGHNGISVTTHLEQEGLWQREPAMLWPTRGEVLIVGAVCLLDELRPDVSISRDTLRGFSFGIRSALQLSVRRAASVPLEAPWREIAESLMKRDLITSLIPEHPTAAEVECDPLALQWRDERIIPVKPASNEWSTVDEVRSLAEQSPVRLSLPRILWSPNREDSIPNRSFYHSLQLAIAELELDIELESLHRYSSSYEVTVRSANRPLRPPGLSVLPPFTVVPYEARDVLIAPRSPANLRHPVMEWFAEHAGTLSVGYPAFFAQIKRALASVATINYQPALEKRRIAADAAQLLNETIDRIRRSVPDMPVPPFHEITADDEGRLISKP
jgi:hypothetical protein